MSKIDCNVIKDLLPLYIDDVASLESRELVNEHLQECDKCVKELDMLKITIEVREDHDITILKQIKNKIFRKKIITTFIVSSCIAALLFGVFFFVMCYEIPMSYEEVSNYLIINEESDGSVTIGIDGLDYYGFYYSVVAEEYNKEDKVAYGEESFYITYTIWTKYFSKDESYKRLIAIDSNGYRIGGETTIIGNIDKYGNTIDGSNEVNYTTYNKYVEKLNYQVWKIDNKDQITIWKASK